MAYRVIRDKGHWHNKRLYKKGEVIPDMNAHQAYYLTGIVEKVAEGDGKVLVTNPASNNPPPPTDALPAGFPAKKELEAGGYTTLTAVGEASDKQLLDVDGVGPSTLQKIKEALP